MPITLHPLIQEQPVLGILNDPLKTGGQFFSCDRTTSDDCPLMRFNGIELQTLLERSVSAPIRTLHGEANVSSYFSNLLISHASSNVDLV